MANLWLCEDFNLCQTLFGQNDKKCLIGLFKKPLSDRLISSNYLKMFLSENGLEFIMHIDGF